MIHLALMLLAFIALFYGLFCAFLLALWLLGNALALLTWPVRAVLEYHAFRNNRRK